MKKIIFLIIFAISCMQSFSQTENFKAQGYYYKAKELFDAKNFEAAIPYIIKSKEALKGTNFQLQYLHILCAANSKDWINARKELNTYIELIEKKKACVGLTNTIEKLSDEETKEISKAMVEIEEKAAYEESPEGIKEKANKEIQVKINDIKNKINDWLSKYTGLDEEYKNVNGENFQYSSKSDYFTVELHDLIFSSDKQDFKKYFDFRRSSQFGRLNTYRAITKIQEIAFTDIDEFIKISTIVLLDKNIYPETIQYRCGVFKLNKYIDKTIYEYNIYDVHEKGSGESQSNISSSELTLALKSNCTEIEINEFMKLITLLKELKKSLK